MIIDYIISAIVLGFIVAIPPGSVTVIACQRAIQFGFRNSLYFSLGSGISDVFYIILVYLGIANVFANNFHFKIVLWIVCGIILITLGLSSIINTLRKTNGNSNVKTLNTGFFATFISGILITLTNPMTIVGWIAIAGNFFLIWNDKLPKNGYYRISTIFLIMTGVYLWFIPLIFIVSRIGRVFGKKIKDILIITSGCILILFGVSAFFFVVRGIWIALT